MKKYIFITILIITCNIFAQIEMTPNSNLDFCKTPSNSSSLIHLETIRGLDHTDDNFYVKLYVHVLRREQTPQLGQSLENINRLMKVLYSDFDPLGIYFSWDGTIDYIDNNQYFDNPLYYSNPTPITSPCDNSDSFIFNTNNHQDGIDIYLFDDLDADGFGLANGIGESTELILGGYWLGDQVLPLSRLKVISHEMGHVLFLWHTHHGTFYEGCDPNQCAELVNPVTDPNDELYFEQATNRSTCGDYISDTPADPNIFFNTNRYTCAYEGGGIDANGDPYQPDTSNLMSYSYPTCLDGFTPKQKSRMKNALWYIDALNNTTLDEYTYIREIGGFNCFVCANSYFEITSTLDISQLSVTSSSNIQTSIISTTGNSFTLHVTNLIGTTDEGESGYFSVSNNGNVVATQPLWVGLPQTVPEEVLSGNETVYANQEFEYSIGIENRLQGIDTYGWVFPEPNAEIDNYNNPDPITWQHLAWDKYFTLSFGLAGNQTGWVSIHGVNPCGDGNEGLENEICVENLSDPEGDTECDSGGGGEIVYYPNPADSLLEVDLSLREYDIFTVTVYDDYQVAVYSDQSENVVKTVETFNLSNGMYYLHIYDSDNALILSNILIINP